MAQVKTIGEMAHHCGLSARSLRHLETRGLIRPVRTQAGRRVYGDREISRITQILALRQTGYRLAEISAVMLSPELDSRKLIDTQIALLRAKHKQIGDMLSRLEHASNLLETRKALDVDSLCSLIRDAQDIMTQNTLKPVALTYFTEEEWETWKTVGSDLFPGDARSAYERQWQDLIARIEAAIASDIAPGSPEARSLTEAWIKLQRPMVDALGEEHWRKTARMYSEMETWQTEDLRAPFSAEVYQFISETNRIMKQQG